MKIINERIHRAGILADEIKMVEEDNNGFNFEMDDQIFSIRNLFGCTGCLRRG